MRAKPGGSDTAVAKENNIQTYVMLMRRSLIGLFSSKLMNRRAFMASTAAVAVTATMPALATEKTVSNNTAAIGGNTTLMTI